MPISATRVREALLALEGSVIEDFRLPLPGDLKDIAKAAALVSGIVEDRIPALLNSVRDRTWDGYIDSTPSGLNSVPLRGPS